MVSMDTVLLLCGSKGFSPTVVWLPYGSSPTLLLFCGFLSVWCLIIMVQAPYPFCCVVSSDLYILHSHWRGITVLCFLLILYTVLLFYLIQSYCCEVPCGPVLQHCVVWFPVTKSYCCVVP